MKNIIRASCQIGKEAKKVEKVMEDLGIEAHFGKDASRFQYDIVIIESDLQELALIKNSCPGIQVIIVGSDKRDAAEAVKLGASAYFTHPLEDGALRQTLQKIIGILDTRAKPWEPDKRLYEEYTFEGSVIGRSEKMLEVFSFIRRIAPYFHTVLISGETGTGKEIIAKMLHELCAKGEPFQVCNCGGLIENLVESVLFGHMKGAFTSAFRDEKGLFETCGRGCIFLDEIGDLPMSFQAHFLRVLQDGEFRPIGSEKTRTSQCRIIAATNRDLEEEVKCGRFRKDLFFRLNPLSLTLPPLRERKEDIPLIALRCLDQFNSRSEKNISGISLSAREALMSYDWPGNVRELCNVIEQAAILTSETIIRIDDLSIHKSGPAMKGPDSHCSLDDAIINHIQDILKQYNGNTSAAAKALGISRWALIRKLKKYHIT